MRVHDSQAYRKMDVTRERISRILELRKILLSFQNGFSLVSSAVVCAILESISGLEPWVQIKDFKENIFKKMLKSKLSRLRPSQRCTIKSMCVL